jgi:hypothetical protein
MCGRGRREAFGPRGKSSERGRISHHNMRSRTPTVLRVLACQVAVVRASQRLSALVWEKSV